MSAFAPTGLFATYWNPVAEKVNALKNTDKFEIQIMDDPDFEDLVAEILFEGELCFFISQEAGFQNSEIRVHGRKSGQPWCFGLAEMEDAIRRARARLWDLRREEG